MSGPASPWSSDDAADDSGQAHGSPLQRRQAAFQSSPGANVVLVAALLAALGLKLGVVQGVEINTLNMAPTLWQGDRVLVHDLGPAPVAGDVVAYDSPFGPNRLQIGRIVATAGDQVELRADGLFVNGAAVGQRPPTPPDCAVGADGGQPCPPTEAIVEEPETDLGREDACREGSCPIHPETLGSHRYLARQAGSYEDLLFPSRAVPDGYVFVLSDNRVDDRDSRIYGVIPSSAIVGTASFIYYAHDETGIRWDRLSRRVS